MSNHRHDIVVLGCSADVEALFRNLDVEAPAMLRRTIVIDPRPATRERLRGSSGHRRADGALGRVLNWRFAVLIAITIVDAIVFVIPLALGAVLVAAVLAPRSLRRVARFLDDLAGPVGRVS